MVGYWNSWLPATCLPYDCFCEAPRIGDIILQPANTWSNLGFVLVGLVVLLDNTQSRDSTYHLFRKLFGIANIILGLMSGFYHASLTFVGQWCDVESMFLVVLCTTLYELTRAGYLGKNGFLGWYFASLVATGWIQYTIPSTRRYLFFVLVLMYLAVNRWLSKQLPQRPDAKHDHIKIGTAIFAISYLVWLLDFRKIVCWPLSYVQGHAIWHILDSIVCYIMYLYYNEPSSKLSH